MRPTLALILPIGFLKLNLEETKAVEAIIMYRSGSPELVTMDLEPFIGWKCPCCKKESGYIFTQEGEAQNDFKTNHLHVECNEDIVTDIDGEKGPDFPLDIKCIKGGVKILGANIAK